MKIKLLFSILFCGLFFLQVSAQTQPKTFTVANGAYPWFDRDNYTLDGIPNRLKGTEPLPQQSCAARGITVPGKPKSITIGVHERDMPAFQTAYPDAKGTGEQFALVPKAGNPFIYKVVTINNPGATIQGSFQAGLILLKVEN